MDSDKILLPKVKAAVGWSATACSALPLTQIRGGGGVGDLCKERPDDDATRGAGFGRGRERERAWSEDRRKEGKAFYFKFSKRDQDEAG